MTFPRLKTNAIAQYPALREVVHASRVLRFVDGGEQRWREWAASRRRWLVQLTELDEGELVTLRDFFAGQQGEAGTFSFTDPWDEAVYPNCSFANGEEVSQWLGEGLGEVRLMIEEDVG